MKSLILVICLAVSVFAQDTSDIGIKTDTRCNLQKIAELEKIVAADPESGAKIFLEAMKEDCLEQEKEKESSK